jgi:hypothetical protein
LRKYSQSLWDRTRDAVNDLVQPKKPTGKTEMTERGPLGSLKPQL